jgi:GT2 family glycosyltransferase
VTRCAPPRTQVLVVDDGSPDDCASATASAFGVEALRLPSRSGFCVAANAGLRAARADVVELLNDDTEVMAGWADAALAHFADGRVAAVAPLVLAWPGGGVGVARVDSAGDTYYAGGFARKRGHGQTLSGRHLRRRRVFGPSASSAFYRREMVLRVGAFPEDFGAYFEDVDLACRLRRAGGWTVYEPRSRVLHRGGCSYGRPSAALVEQQSRNEERLFWRNVAGSELPWAVPLHAAVLAGKCWLRWREGTLVPFLRGRARALAESCRRAPRRSGARE